VEEEEGGRAVKGGEGKRESETAAAEEGNNSRPSSISSLRKRAKNKIPKQKELIRKDVGEI
jgi:hypothetical protein